MTNDLVLTRVAVLGPGAIGCAVAAAADDAGHEVVLVGRSPFAAIDVQWPNHQTTFDATFIEPGDGSNLDAIFLGVKAHQTSAVADWMQQLSSGGAPVFIFQNGVEHVERVAPHVHSSCDPIAVIIDCPAHRISAGEVTVSGDPVVTAEAGPHGVLLERLFAGSSIRVELVDDLVTPAWTKLLINAALGGISVATQTTAGVFAKDPNASWLAVALMDEIIEVARAEGATIAPEVPHEIMERVAAGTSHGFPSITVDRIAGVPSEWSARNEVVERIAARHGIDVPLNRALTALIRLGEPGERLP